MADSSNTRITSTLARALDDLVQNLSRRVAEYEAQQEAYRQAEKSKGGKS